MLLRGVLEGQQHDEPGHRPPPGSRKASRGARARGESRCPPSQLRRGSRDCDRRWWSSLDVSQSAQLVGDPLLGFDDLEAFQLVFDGMRDELLGAAVPAGPAAAFARSNKAWSMLMFMSAFPDKEVLAGHRRRGGRPNSARIDGAMSTSAGARRRIGAIADRARRALPGRRRSGRRSRPICCRQDTSSDSSPRQVVPRSPVAAVVADDQVRGQGGGVAGIDLGRRGTRCESPADRRGRAPPCKPVDQLRHQLFLLRRPGSTMPSRSRPLRFRYSPLMPSP